MAEQISEMARQAEAEIALLAAELKAAVERHGGSMKLVATCDIGGWIFTHQVDVEAPAAARCRNGGA